jgi:hypothetical protein
MKHQYMKHQWNTGRHYDAHGQRMVALVADNAIVFSDLSRGINGSVPLGDYLRGHRLDTYTLESLVMTNYDFGNYSGGTATLTWD